MSLRAKLVLWYTAVFAVSGSLLCVTLYLLIAHALGAEADRFLEEEFQEVRQITRDLLPQPAALKARIAAELRHARAFAYFYRLHDPAAGRDLLAVAAKGLEEAATACPAPAAPEPAYSWVEVGQPPKSLRVLSAALDPAASSRLMLQLGVHNRWLERRTAALRKYLAGTLFAAVLIAALGGWALASRSLRPIDRIAADLSRVESTTLDARLPVSASRDEVARLRQAINRMLDRLSAAFGRLQSFTADAAHELRTPLTALQLRLETAINRPRSEAEAREAINDALHQVAELSSLVENLLLLAQMDAEHELPAPVPVDLVDLLRRIEEPFALLAEEKNISLAIEANGPVTTIGDPVLLRRVFGNLLDNALRYTPAGGRVTARVACGPAGCVVTVSDTGVGIAPEAIGRVFDRFYRADESRSRADGGAGLGLSIAKRAVELHRGTIAIESTPGKGTTVTVRLPPPRPCTA
ncbi:MAG: HAMP domain-containing protein [Planctomycetes bacterium]|nr:HAMP domain-containing protein [Planctomycetota bacterium]